MTRFPMPHPALALMLLGTLTACGGPRDDYPGLVPMEQLVAEPAIPAHAGAAVADSVATQNSLDSESAARRARADAVRGPVSDAETAARMRAAQARQN